MAADWEFAVLDAFESIRNEFLTYIFKFFTYLGDKGIFWISLCLLLIIIPKTRKIGIYAGIALLIQVLLGELMLKHIIQRERPFVIDTSIDTIIPIPMGKYSFPSGHSSSSAAVALSVFLQNRKLGIPLMITALMIMVSRLYFCVHFPTDIIGGLILGAAVAVAVFFMLNFIIKKYNIKIPGQNK